MDSFLNLYRTGRLPRFHFFLLCLVVMIVEMLAARILFGIVSTVSYDEILATSQMHFFALLVLIINVFIVWPITARRLHDVDLSGWWIVPFELLSFIPAVGGIITIAIRFFLLFKKGTEGANRFGPAPSPDRRLMDALWNR